MTGLERFGKCVNYDQDGSDSSSLDGRGRCHPSVCGVVFMIARAVGFLWLLPIGLVFWLFYLLPVWLMGWVKWVGWDSFLIGKFHLVPGDTWYHRLWHNWAGFGGPCFMILVPEHELFIIKHERRHCIQCFWMGTLFPVLYFFGLWWGLVFTDEGAYRGNPLEVDARNANGGR